MFIALSVLVQERGRDHRIWSEETIGFYSSDLETLISAHFSPEAKPCSTVG